MMTTTTTFVTCLFEYEESFLDLWLGSGLTMVFYTRPDDLDRVLNKVRSDNVLIQVKELPPVSEIEWYDDDRSVRLPAHRNEEKDTMEHLWNMHLKVHCVNLEATIGETPFYAYIDFDAPKMMETTTLQNMRDTFAKPHIFTVAKNGNDHMYFPGCWGKVHEMNAEYGNKINWRFCGTFFFGGRDAVLQFHQLNKTYFADFMQIMENVLSWEVNYWAYLEWKVDDWKPLWYSANHDDTLVKIPGIFGYKILMTDSDEKTPTTTMEYKYPNMSPYRPMSAAYVEYRGKSYINTRCVNYWIYDNGGYYYPEDEGVIRTLNICSELSSSDSLCHPYYYEPMKDDLPPPATVAFSNGIEDIRLYVSQVTGELCFIGSTLGYSHVKDRIRMVRGVYDVETYMCRDIQHLDAPTETWCEKNWAPIPIVIGGEKEDGFVYKWYPLEIGRVVSGRSGKLEIVVRKEMDDRFRNMKGSTAFVPYGEDGLIGVVHFSEEMHPRQYYHRVVVLHRETFEVVKCSDVFCFQKASVEFCIGFRVIVGDDRRRIGFWISRMDRDPMYIETDLGEFIL